MDDIKEVERWNYLFVKVREEIGGGVGGMYWD